MPEIRDAGWQSDGVRRRAFQPSLVGSLPQQAVPRLTTLVLILWLVGSSIPMLGCSGPATRSGGPHPRVGHPAPDFRLPTADGTTTGLSDMRGRVVLVNFWGTYCPPCTEEMPNLQRLYNRYESDGFKVVGIDVEESSEVVHQFAARLGLTFPLLLSDDASVNPTFGIRALPTSWLVDRSGIIRQVWVGKVPIEDAEVQIESLLGEGGSTQEPTSNP